MSGPIRVLAAPALVAALALAPGAHADTVAAALGRGDAAWAQRAEGHRGIRARPEPMAAAVAAYGAALAADPASLEAHWKRVRALWFAAQFAAAGPDDRQARADRAHDAAVEAMAALHAALGGRDPAELPPAAIREALGDRAASQAAPLFFWSAVAWGTWARSEGLFAAVREGAANRMHRNATQSIALAPGLERGGAQRLLARLHTELPHVPFVSGWVDRSKAVPWAERACAIDPGYAGNQLSLALTWLDLDVGARRADAIALLEKAGASEPSAPDVVEDLAIREQALQRLRALGGDETPVQRAAGSETPCASQAGDASRS